MNQNTNNTAAAPFTGGAAGTSAKMKPKTKALDYIAVELEKKDLLFSTRRQPELFSIGMRICIHCGERCNGGRILNARKLLASPDKARIAVLFSLDSDEAQRVLTDAPGFWHWKGDNLHVDLYPLMYEKKTLDFRARQSGNRASGWNKKRKAVPATPTTNPPANNQIPQSLPDYLADSDTQSNTINKNASK